MTPAAHRWTRQNTHGLRTVGSPPRRSGLSNGCSPKCSPVPWRRRPLLVCPQDTTDVWAWRGGKTASPAAPPRHIRSVHSRRSRAPGKGCSLCTSSCRHRSARSADCAATSTPCTCPDRAPRGSPARRRSTRMHTCTHAHHTLRAMPQHHARAACRRTCRLHAPACKREANNDRVSTEQVCSRGARLSKQHTTHNTLHLQHADAVRPHHITRAASGSPRWAACPTHGTPPTCCECRSPRRAEMFRFFPTLHTVSHSAPRPSAPMRAALTLPSVLRILRFSTIKIPPITVSSLPPLPRQQCTLGRSPMSARTRGVVEEDILLSARCSMRRCARTAAPPFERGGLCFETLRFRTSAHVSGTRRPTSRGKHPHPDVVARRVAGSRDAAPRAHPQTEATLRGRRHNAAFSSLVNADSRELRFSSRRQRYLVDQGYAYAVKEARAILKELTEAMSPAELAEMETEILNEIGSVGSQAAEKPKKMVKKAVRI